MKRTERGPTTSSCVQRSFAGAQNGKLLMQEPKRAPVYEPCGRAPKVGGLMGVQNEVRHHSKIRDLGAEEAERKARLPKLSVQKADGRSPEYAFLKALFLASASALRSSDVDRNLFGNLQYQGAILNFS